MRQRPAVTGRRFGRPVSFSQALRGPQPRASSSRLPVNWRDRLPDPATYYAEHLNTLTRPNVTGWAQARCPFHDDHNASLSVHVLSDRGHWRCFASCGGGDMVGFHMRRTGLNFPEAVRALIGSAR